jgi:hypothetical protein
LADHNASIWSPLTQPIPSFNGHLSGNHSILLSLDPSLGTKRHFRSLNNMLPYIDHKASHNIPLELSYFALVSMWLEHFLLSCHWFSMNVRSNMPVLKDVVRFRGAIDNPASNVVPICMIKWRLARWTPLHLWAIFLKSGKLFFTHYSFFVMAIWPGVFGGNTTHHRLRCASTSCRWVLLIIRTLVIFCRKMGALIHILTVPACGDALD